ncbi:MAG: SpoIIE family protein phosphatase [Phycisphaerae bacterium]|nr:SpoIIE family protein phosphatase [Phycisphaerae bacterium]
MTNDQSSADAHRSDPERVMLVDDNPTNLQVLHQTLSGRGYELRIAKSGEDALAIARKARPALMLLDIMMPPGIDGYEVCRRLKADPETRDVDVIFLSALDDTKDKVKGLELGAVDYIAKPFQAEEVIARVNTHLTVHRLRRDLARRNDDLEAANARIEAANVRMKRDLEAAAKVQHALLPTELPELPGARFAWRYRPCEELAGDSLNVFAVDDGHVCMYVLDVSGHGVQSSLLSVSVTHSLALYSDRSSLIREPSGDGYRVVGPAEVARRLNEIYPMDFEGGAPLYFTLSYGILDTRTGVYRYATAGHPGPIVLPAGGAPHFTDWPATPIGTLRGAEYEEHELRLDPGDRLYLHSDGVTEEQNGRKEQFERDRLLAVIERSRQSSLDESLDAIIREVVSWRGDDHFTDDVSLLAVEITDR